jgi:hypothetical protein
MKVRIGFYQGKSDDHSKAYVRIYGHGSSYGYGEGDG